MLAVAKCDVQLLIPFEAPTFCGCSPVGLRVVKRHERGQIAEQVVVYAQQVHQPAAAAPPVLQHIRTAAWSMLHPHQRLAPCASHLHYLAVETCTGHACIRHAAEHQQCA